MARILIVDDEQDITDILQGQIAKFGGHACEVAASAKEGIARVGAAMARDGGEYDLIISDIRMPGMDGFDFLHRIMSEVEAVTPCIILTGSSEVDTAIRAVRERAFDFLKKPWDTNELKRAVERALERRDELKRRRQRQRDLEQRVSAAEAQLRMHSDATVAGFFSLLEGKDAVLADRAVRSRTLASRLGRELSVEGKDLQALEVGALLHDVGMCMIPNTILRKSGELDERDREVMRTHAALGGDLCGHISALKAAGEVVRHHHEKWDGGGYPSGLKGSAIPLGARIVAVVDAFVAITSPSPYQPSRSPADALAEIRRCAGWQFDPAVVAAFERIFPEVAAGSPAPGGAAGA